MSYMELGESHAWQKPATADGNGNAAVERKEEWGGKVASAGPGGSAAGSGSGSGRITNTRTGVGGGGRANVQSHGSSVYEDDFTGGFR